MLLYLGWACSVWHRYRPGTVTDSPLFVTWMYTAKDLLEILLFFKKKTYDLSSAYVKVPYYKYYLNLTHRSHVFAFFYIYFVDGAS